MLQETDKSPLAHGIDEAVERTGVNRTALFAALKRGQLKAVKLGRRTLILDRDLRSFLNSLPARHASEQAE
jgi:hypothetical protein